MNAETSRLEHAARLAMAYHPPRGEQGPSIYRFAIAVSGTLFAAVAILVYALSP